MNLKDSTLYRQQAYIDGRWQDAASSARIAIHNPANGTLVGEVPVMGADETRLAIDAAARALPEWSRRTAKERAAILRRWADLMTANAEDLAVIMTSEQGKPLAEAKGEVAYAASFIEWFAEEGKRSMAMSSRHFVPTPAFLCCVSLWALLQPSHRGISPPP